MFQRSWKPDLEAEKQHDSGPLFFLALEGDQCVAKSPLTSLTQRDVYDLFFSLYPQSFKGNRTSKRSKKNKY